MRILLITQWFEPEPTFKGLSFARELKRLGHEVEVLTGFPNYPGGKVYPGYKIRWFSREAIDGIRINRVPLYPSHDGSALRRILNYCSFAFTSAVLGPWVTKRADVIHVYHPPATIGLAPLVLKLLKGTPYVFDVHDLWPDTLEATGMVRSRTLLSLVGLWCRVVYRFSSRVLVISPGFKERLERSGVPSGKVSVCYNWADQSVIQQAGTQRAISEFEGRFNVVFAGTMGKAQALDCVLDAARILKSRCPRAQLVLIGGGVDRERLEKRARELELDNVVFLPRRPMGEIGEVLRQAGALLVHLKDDPLFRITVPSKTQAYLAIGRPIVMALEGDSAELVRRAGAGMVCAAGDPGALAETIERMTALPQEQLEKMGKSGAEFYARELSFEAGVSRIVEALTSASQDRFALDLFQRLLDLLIAVPLAVLALPLILVTAVLVLLNLGAPVFFRQVRPGKFGKPFAIMKFRTMTDTRGANGRLLPDAERLTALGRWIRRLSLDELPQLWNVLKGDMSLVGPRPLLMAYLPRYSARQARRHDVRPGVTGWAQVNGRNALEWDAKFELDVWYVENRSLRLYFEIILRTFAKVFRGDGVSKGDHATMPEFLGSQKQGAGGTSWQTK